MYKVFFNDRVIFVCDKSQNLSKKNDLLIHPFEKKKGLKDVVLFFIVNDSIKELYVTSENPEKVIVALEEVFKLIKAAGGVVKNNEGEILFIFRRGKWDLPKGKLSKKESIEHAAIRETSEECGINGMTITKHLINTYHLYKEKGEYVIKKSHWFEMTYSGNEKLIPQLEEDITDAQWKKITNLDEVYANTFPSIKEVLAYLTK